MKLSVKVLLGLLLIVVMSSCSFGADLPSLTMLSTKTCPACEQMSQVINQLKTNYSGKISASKVYLEDNPDIAKQYNVRYVPTLLFKDANGKMIATEIGYKSLEQVLAVFRKAGINI